MSPTALRSKIARRQSPTGRDHPLPEWPTFPPVFLNSDLDDVSPANPGFRLSLLQSRRNDPIFAFAPLP
jgi:hypothetical protein